MSKRVLIINEEFEPSSGFIDEYISTQDALPNLLTAVLSEYDCDLDLKRIALYAEFPNLQKEDERESEVTLNLLREGRKDEAEDYQIRMVLEFIEKHPQFKPLVSGVESRSSSVIRMILGTLIDAFTGGH